MLRRLKNRLIAKAITRYPGLSERFIASYTTWEADETPWTPVSKELSSSRVAIVTTAGVHHIDQVPFDMTDPEGDPSFREIDTERPVESLMITHDYYDYSDAYRDINIVFPIDRLREFEDEGIIGKVSKRNYGFMGHIDGRHIPTLIEKTAPEVARRLIDDNVDIVLLTPG